MTLEELYTQVAPDLTPSSRKDVHTAVRVLATVLDCRDPHQCLPEHYLQPVATLTQLVETSLRSQQKGLSTIKNTKNYLSRLFRLAEARQLLTPPPAPLLTPRYDPQERPCRPGTPASRPHGVSLPYRDWPPPLQEAFGTFEAWATARFVPGRDAKLRKRPVTVDTYRRYFEGYFGYLHHGTHHEPRFEDLFDVERVSAYVSWHVNVYHQQTTSTIFHFLKQLLALSRQYRPDEALTAQLLKLQGELPPLHPVYDKEDAWVPMADLERVGLTIWPRRLPHEMYPKAAIPGLHQATYAGLSLMLRLWRYIPYRQRNMRQMLLKENLRQDDGRWHIIFRGEQLKVALRRGKENVFDRLFPPALVPDLDTYLAVWRPLLLRAMGHEDPHVFLTRGGRPYDYRVLHKSTSHIVYRYTGKHWHPHIVRTVWATEWIKGGGDFLTGALFLNDTLQTMLKNYAHLRNDDDAKVYEALDDRRRQQTQGK